MKNKSFSNIQFEFEDFDENEKIKKFDIKDDEIKDADHYIDFSYKSIFQKSEIKFNNFLNEKLDTRQINKKPKIVTPYIGISTYTSFILDKPKNKLFLFGENYFNKINTITNDIISENNLNFSKIKKFCFGRIHCLLLFENNDLYSCGMVNNSACGFSKKNGIWEIKTPKKIEFFKNKKIKDIWCSRRCSYVQLDNNKFYSFGDNSYGQLGIGKKEYDNDEICNIKFFNDKLIKDVFISNDGGYCFFLDYDNKVYGFDDNNYNVLGIFENENHVSEPTKIKSLENIKIKKIFPGAHHVFVLDENGSLFTFGDNDRGACGLGHDKKITRIEEVDFFKKHGEEIILISQGYYFTIFLTKSSKVYCCGSNYHGQLGLGKIKKVIEIKENEFFKDKNIIDIKSCFSSTLLLSKNGTIYGFGMNEYGQLGYEKYEDQPIPVQIYKI